MNKHSQSLTFVACLLLLTLIPLLGYDPAVVNAQTGSSIPLPIPTVPSGEYVQLAEGFEATTSIFDTTPTQTGLFTNANNAYEGSRGLWVRNGDPANSVASLKSPIDLATPGFTSIELAFWYLPRGYAAGEGFRVDFFDGTNWVTVQEYIRGEQFYALGRHYPANIKLYNSAATPFALNNNIRIQNLGDVNQDIVYIDTFELITSGAVAELALEGFESGFGGYTDGGTDASTINFDNFSFNYAHNSSRSAFVKNGTPSAFFSLTNPLDLTAQGPAELTVDFWYYAVNQETGEGFELQVDDGSGAGWQTVQQYEQGSTLSTNQLIHEQLLLTSSDFNFSASVTFRFVGTGSDNSERVYFDDIRYLLNLSSPKLPGYAVEATETFEGGFGIFADGGANAQLISNPTYTYEQTRSIRLRDGQDGAEMALKAPLDLETGQASELIVDFYYRPGGYSLGEGFQVEFYDGANWHVVKSFIRGDEYSSMGQFYPGRVRIKESEFAFSNMSNIRFKSMGDRIQDNVFIDLVTLSTLAPYAKLRVDGFEDGFKQFSDGGLDTGLINYDNFNFNYGNTGSFGGFVKNGSTTANISLTTPLDLTSSADDVLWVDFYYYALNQDAGEGFEIQVDTGSGWSAVQTFVDGALTTNSLTHEQVSFTSADFPFTDSVELRLQGTSDNNNERVYFDDIQLFTLIDGAEKLVAEGFEDGFHRFVPGGTNTILNSVERYTEEGMWNAFVRFAQPESVLTQAESIDVVTPGFQAVRLDFAYYAIGYDAGEGFEVELFDASAGSWQTVAAYLEGADLIRNVRVPVTLILDPATVPFSDGMRLRFKSSGDLVNERVHFDEIVVWGAHGAASQPPTIAWTQIATGAQPAVTDGFAMAYDPDRDVAVLYGGGLSWPYSVETWEFDGANWALVNNGLTQAPNAVYGMSLTYDPDNQRMLLFGGSDSQDNELNELWSYAGGVWTNVSPAGQTPPARTGHSAVWDPTQWDADLNSPGWLTVYGGNERGTVLGDLWGFNGSSWDFATVTANTPAGRTEQAMVYRENGNDLEFVVYGGRLADGSLSSETAIFNLTTADWTSTTSGGDPGGRMKHAMVYWPEQGQAVLMGGTASASESYASLAWFLDGTGGWATLPDGPAVMQNRPAAAVHNSTDGSIIVFTGNQTWELK